MLHFEKRLIARNNIPYLPGLLLCILLALLSEAAEAQSTKRRCFEALRSLAIATSHQFPEPVEADFRLKLDSTLKLIRSVRRERSPEQIVKKLLKNRGRIPAAPSIVEVGAHIGGDSREFMNLWPDANLIAFEARPDLHRIAQLNLEKFPNARVLPFAIGHENRDDVLLFAARGGDQGSSSILEPKLHERFFPWIHFPPSRRERVSLRRLDDLPEISQLPEIDILWIDVQGAEHLVLQGAKETLKRTTWLFTEVNYAESYEGTMIFKDLQSLLASAGFRLAMEFQDNALQGNALFGRFEK